MSGTAQDFRLRSKTCRKSILLLVLLLVHWSLVHHFQDFWGLDLAELCLFQAVRKVGGGWQGSQDIKAQHLWFRILEAQMETGD